MDALQSEVDDLKEQLQTLQDNFNRHNHDGLSSQHVSITDLDILFQTVSVVPTTVPKTIYDQVQIYTNSTTYRLYWYDAVNKAWRYATGT